MTKDEKKEFQELKDLTRELVEQNKKLHNTVEVFSKAQLDKNLPLSLENNVVNTVNDSIREAMKKVIVDSYNSPLKGYANSVILSYEKDIIQKMSDILESEINTDEFNEEFKSVIKQKLIRTVISSVDSNIKNKLDKLNKDEVFRSKVTLMLNNLINEYVK